MWKLSGYIWLIQVDFPVPLGPNRKKLSLGAANSLEAIAHNVNAYIAMKAGNTPTKTSTPQLIAAAGRYTPA